MKDHKFEPVLTQLWRYRVGLISAPPGCGPTYHSQDYFEAFMPLTGLWRYCWQNDAEGGPAGEVFVRPEDLVFLPTRPEECCFENVSSEDAWLLAIAEIYR